jgi:DNA-binding GntR family transcriptional regulator
MPKVLTPLRIVRSPGYREAAYAAIKEAILSRQFAPGEPLIEEQIATILNISRTPVREALAILQHEELLAPRNGRGLYVRELTREEFVAMFVANETVEPYLARQAAVLATEEQLAQIKSAIDDGKRAIAERDLVGALRSGRDFHRLVGFSAGNLPLMQFVTRNEEHTDLYLLNADRAVDVTGLDASNREHEAIYEAIVQRDPEAATRLVIFHSVSIRTRLAAFFNSARNEQSATQLVEIGAN